MPATDLPTAATRELLEQLVALDSTSTHSNLAVIELCEQVLGDAGATLHRVPDPTGDDRAGLLARLGPDVDGGVVLSGHTDCVPVTGQPWTVDPFAVTERDGLWHGRGTTDMKGFIACVLATAPTLAATELARPVWVLLTWDEEVGTVGAGPVTDALVERTRPSCAVVGEPTLMRPVTSHKGVRSSRVTVTGRDGHSSQPARGANALVAAARFAVHLDEVAARLRADGGDDRFDPPETTINVATLAAGQAINIIPRAAELTWEYRPVPADDSWAIAERAEQWARRTLLPPLRAVDEACAIDVERVAVVPTLADEDGPDVAVTDPGAAERLVRALTGDDHPAGTVPFGTDGGWHQRAGISTVVCGPGDIAQAHQPDEWIAPSQLAACEHLLVGLADHLADA